MANQVRNYFPKGGHAATQTELKVDLMNKHKVKHHRNSAPTTSNREPHQNHLLGASIMN